MIVWSLVIVIALIVGAALFYAGRAGPVNASADRDRAAETAHQKNLLAEIEADLSAGRISQANATAAKAELAREVIRTEKTVTSGPAAPAGRAWFFAAAAAFVVIGSLGTYALTGDPGLPGAPLAGRATEVAQKSSLDTALAKVEAQMLKTPDDIRGWRVLAPVYMQQGRFEDAANAYRNIVRLEKPVTADARIDLAEALIMANRGVAAGEAQQELEKAIAIAPDNQRALYYLAGEATRVGDYERAKTLWQGLVDSASGTESWLPTAKRGLQVAEAGLKGEAVSPPAATATAGQNAAPDQNQQEMIRGMVEGLATRLASEGGSVDEWLRLVRSRLVMGDAAQAQKDYDAAKAAYPDPADRGALDAFAARNGLK